MLSDYNYRIYPSLLIAFQKLLDYEQVAEEDWNKVSEAAHNRGEYLDKEVGDYKLDPDEMYLKLECDLLDSINRIDGEYGEAADKGTAFNEIVDALIERRKSNREDCKIYSAIDEAGIKVIRADIHDYSFDFDIALCKQAANFFKGSVTQYLAQASINTAYGTVLLYGYIDEWVGNKMYDIKTTSNYSWGKFEKGWQRYVYPYCVIEAGDTTEVDSFTYWVVEWAKNNESNIITAKGIYKEEYTYNHQEATEKIREMCECFIEWLNARKEFIQDKRIFGGKNPPNWHGQPTDIETLKQFLFTNSLNMA